MSDSPCRPRRDFSCDQVQCCIGVSIHLSQWISPCWDICTLSFLFPLCSRLYIWPVVGARGGLHVSSTNFLLDSHWELLRDMNNANTLHPSLADHNSPVHMHRTIYSTYCVYSTVKPLPLNTKMLRSPPSSDRDIFIRDKKCTRV